VEYCFQNSLFLGSLVPQLTKSNFSQIAAANKKGQNLHFGRFMAVSVDYFPKNSLKTLGCFFSKFE
jgi:hypothetical protein